MRLLKLKELKHYIFLNLKLFKLRNISWNIYVKKNINIHLIN